MEIGINALKLYSSQDYRNAGISHYIRQLTTHLLNTDSENHYTLFTNNLMPEWREPTRHTPTIVTSRLPTAHPVPRILWEQTVLAWRAAHDKLDVLHCPLNVIPMGAACPTVLTIHDLTFLRYPRLFPQLKRQYLRLFTRLSAQHANAVVAVSASTRDDVVQMLGVPQERVHVVHHAADADFRPRAQEECSTFRTSKGLPNRYVLYVGTLEPRKNVDVLIRAFGKVVREEKLPHSLVLVGAKGWMTQAIQQAIAEANVGERLLMPGYVARAELPLWYSSADVFVYPSTYEGFGYPVLEAMASGTPVITSNTSSMPEIASDAGVLVSPREESTLAAAMASILTDTALADSLRARGLEQASRFSWDKSVRTCMNLYQSLGTQAPTQS
ncbi:MAG: glycosyltransferase family 4 protein [Chloroflexi bacterium]|nr:glycosyltransferase family 4 protein [Chloroflexota bacterium]